LTAADGRDDGKAGDGDGKEERLSTTSDWWPKERKEIEELLEG